MRILRFLFRQPILSALRPNEQLVSTRKIYTVDQLSVTKYENDRRRMGLSLRRDTVELKKTHLKNLIENPKTMADRIAFELTQLMHLIEETDDDFQLIEQAMNRLKSINTQNLRTHSIGMTLMKMLYHFKNEKLAMKFYSDPNLCERFFGNKQTLLVFFDLLYKQHEYTVFLKHFRELLERLESKQQQITRSLYVLAFAVCYRQNTEKSFEYAKLLNEQYKDRHITQDHCIFFSALAINQNDPELSNQILSKLWPTSHEAIPTLRLLTLLQMYKFVDALKLLRSILLIYDNNVMPKSDFISNEAMEMAEKVFNKSCQDERLRNDFQNLRDSLQTHGYCVEKSINQMIFEPFRKERKTPTQIDRLFLRNEFNRLFDDTNNHR